MWAAMGACYAPLDLHADGINTAEAGRNALQAGDNDTAIRLLSRAIDAGLEGGDAVTAHVLRGVAHSNRGEWDQAIADYDVALRLDQKSVVAHTNKGNALAQKGLSSDAIAEYDKALSLDPNYVNAYIGRGNAHADLRNYTQGLNDLDTALKLDPANLIALQTRAYTYFRANQIDHAVEGYSQVLKRDPGAFVAYSGRAAAYSRLGRYDLALKDLDQAVSLSANNPTIIAARGRARYLAGMFSLAVEDFSHVQGLAPKDQYAWIWLILAKMNLDRSWRPARLPVNAGKDTWPTPVAMFLSGQLGEKQLMALARTQSVKDEEGRQCEADTYVGEYFWLKGQIAKARKHFENAIGSCPDRYMELWFVESRLASATASQS